MTTAPLHHGPHGFRNPHLLPGARDHAKGFLTWQLGLGPPDPPALTSAVPPYQPQLLAPDLDKIRHPDRKVIQLTWVGHDTFIIQAAGRTILTDPIYSERASPLAGLGPRRYAPPGLDWEALPSTDTVLISHNHYDHLDRPTIRRLGPGRRYFVPLGLGKWFGGLGLDQVGEMDWWQSAALGPIRLTCVPAQHFSMRTPFDRNRSLWCGWVMETPVGTIYFAGCSGYSPDFQKIGDKFGPMRLSLIPIGCYMPRWFMKPMHVNPPEAVKIHQDVRSQQSIGIHWGTFKLTDEPMGEPPLYLKQAMAQAGLPPEEFTVMNLGETRLFI
jgi:N-acyl-phosphatidylethanolamine-hydrolysing phospholipase D